MPATVAEHEITERAAKSTLEPTTVESTTLEPTLEPAAEPFGSFVRAKSALRPTSASRTLPSGSR